MVKLEPWHALAALNVVVLTVLAWGHAWSQAQPTADGIIRARQIDLVNDEGEMRAQLHIAADGGGELRLRSSEGEIRVKFGATSEGAILLMMDGRTEPTVRLATDEAGPRLSLTASDGAARMIAP